MQILRQAVTLPFLVSWALVPIIFAIDLEIPLGYAGGMLYVVPVALGLWAPKARYVWAMAGIATALTVIGFFASDPGAHIAWTVYVNRVGAVVAIVTVAMVVAREVVTQRELRATQARLSEAQRVAHIGSLDCDIDRRTVRASEEAQRLLRLDSEVVSPEQLLDRVLDADRQRMRAAVIDAVTAGEPINLSCRVEPSPGDIRVVMVTANVAAATPSSPRRLLATVQDVSEQKRLEDEFLQAQKLEAVGRLAGGVAHDVNNVLMGINGCLDVALSRLPDDSPVRPLLLEAKKSGSSGAAITRQLLSLGRKRDSEESHVEIDSLVGSTEEMLRRLLGAAVRVNVRLGAHRAFVRCDAGRVQQIVMNLVVNARDAMPDGGRLTLETAEVCLGRSDRRRYPQLEPGRYVKLTISDTGCGMDEHTRSRAFEPFFTTKEIGLGTGLGLSTTYSIVEDLGGHIDLESQVGVGTTFRIFLPRVDPPEESAPVSVRPAPDGHGETVLVVEDEPLVRRAAVHYLERRGYRVCAAKDAEEGLELFRARTEPIDVLLTDVMLPGMSGLELAAQVRRDHPEVRIVYMSAYSADLIARNPAALEGAPTLHKPFEEEELAAAVGSVLVPDPPPAGSSTGGSTILLVEDNAAARMATCELLGELGYEVLAASTGCEARQLAADHADDIGLLLTDLGLPDVSGVDLVAELKQLLPSVGVIYVSGRPRDDSLVQKALAQSECEYLQKPVDFDEVVASVSRMLH